MPEGHLSALLEEEYFLLKILAHVLDDGIHECRLVCRRWYEASRKLPVKLGEMRMDDIQHITEAFPTVASLHFFNAPHTPDVLETHLVPYLSQIRHLQHLQLPLYRTCQIPDSLTSSLRSVEHLQSLSLKIDAPEIFRAMTDVVRELPRLTALTIHAFCRVDVDPLPITELKRLQKLTGNINVLVSRSGELLFPSLTQLTQLEISCKSSPAHLHDALPKLQVRQRQ